MVELTTLITRLCAISLFHVTDLARKPKVLSKVRIQGQLELSRAFPNKTPSAIKLKRMKQNLGQRVSFDLPIEMKKVCWENGPLFKETLLMVCNTACLVPVCLGTAVGKNLGASLGARRSQGSCVSAGESAGLALTSWGHRIVGLPTARLKAKEKISQSSRRVCCLVNLSLQVSAWEKHFH